MCLSYILVFISLICGTMGSTATFRRADDRSGRCTYSFTVPSPTESSCPEPRQSMPAIQELQRDNLAYKSEVSTIKTRLALLESLMTRLQGGLPSTGSLAPGAPSVVDLQNQIVNLKREKTQYEAQVNNLEVAYTELMAEKSALEEEKQRLQREKENLTRRLEGSNQEIIRLRANQCPQMRETPVQNSQPTSRDGQSYFSGPTSRQKDQTQRQASTRVTSWDRESTGYQELKSELTEVPASRLLQEGPKSPSNLKTQDQNSGCGELTSVGDPITYRKADTIAGKYGVWMRDPEFVAPYTRETTWRIDTVGTDIRQVFEYDDLDQFAKGYPSRVHVLTKSIESTGAVVYRGFLYYQKRKSRTLIKYDLKTETIVLQKELDNAGFHGQYPYSWGGYTDIDLAVDELGLWAIYSNAKAKGSIVISKLNPDTLEIESTWETNIRKQSVANTFMICGTLYTLSSYSSQHATISFAYNVSTSTGKQLRIPFENRYRYNSMTDYNPREKKLFAWDNSHMVVYDVRLTKM
ncbi:myocilin [Protopterus annectens]|uniref:myocilin n=1 Tax=Protopterus annectens TaxID=7888 RepID=UPI001CF9E618|nr:myocilin [Protopterus annectens]